MWVTPFWFPFTFFSDPNLIRIHPVQRIRVCLRCMFGYLLACVSAQPISGTGPSQSGSRSHLFGSEFDPDLFILHPVQRIYGSGFVSGVCSGPRYLLAYVSGSGSPPTLLTLNISNYEQYSQLYILH